MTLGERSTLQSCSRAVTKTPFIGRYIHSHSTKKDVRQEIDFYGANNASWPYSKYRGCHQRGSDRRCDGALPTNPRSLSRRAWNTTPARWGIPGARPFWRGTTNIRLDTGEWSRKCHRLLRPCPDLRTPVRYRYGAWLLPASLRIEPGKQPDTKRI